MTTLLCMDDATYSLANAVLALSNSGFHILATADTATALELAASNTVAAVILNCHRVVDNGPLVTALRILRPNIAVIMLSGYCGVPCTQLQHADACIQKGDNTEHVLRQTLQSVLAQRRFGLCRCVAA